jgi:hypothetical protein
MKPAAKPNPLIEIAVTIIVPAVVLMKFSSADSLGPLRALLVGLAFPLGWGLWDGWRRRKLNWLAVLGVVSTLLTGGIGLLALDAKWLAVKEATIPTFNKALLAKGNASAFEKRLRQGTILLAATFLFSAVANYLLARWVVTSPAGTEAFNQELGRLTLLSYPIIAIPSMLMMMGLMFWLAREAKTLTGLAMGDMLQGG